VWRVPLEVGQDARGRIGEDVDEAEVLELENVDEEVEVLEEIEGVDEREGMLLVLKVMRDKTETELVAVALLILRLARP